MAEPNANSDDALSSPAKPVRGQVIARLKITLEGIFPEVSRILEVPTDFRLDRLHLAIQAAMGWENEHLYEFTAGKTRWALPDPYLGREARPIAKASLADVITASKQAPIFYTYDFGDDWRHRIEIRLIGDPEPGNLYPRLTEIAGRCPPEDIGGPPGYELFLEAIGNPDHPEHEEMTEWVDDSFDPNAPDADELRSDVLKLAKRWKPRKPKDAARGA